MQDFIQNIDVIFIFVTLNVVLEDFFLRYGKLYSF